jgi:uncharacterized linocin/CFP29 family protein
MGILRRHLAPITDTAWEEIDGNAKIFLSAFLSARKIVDVVGPKGLDYAALPLGRLDLPKQQKKGEVEYGVHRVQPLVEARVDFALNIWELDNVARGARDIDFGAMEEAARKIALFEETAVYNGFKPGGIAGMKSAGRYKPLKLTTDAEKIPETISTGITQFVEETVEGPYALIAGPEVWRLISSAGRGYPLRKRIESLLGGPIVLSPFIEDGFLVSMRGGDLRLVLGQDFSIGYNSHDSKTVRLYFTESFTFQIVDPAVVMPFVFAAGKRG